MNSPHVNSCPLAHDQPCATDMSAKIQATEGEIRPSPKGADHPIEQLVAATMSVSPLSTNPQSVSISFSLCLLAREDPVATVMMS